MASLAQVTSPPLAGRQASISNPTALAPGSTNPISASMRWPADRKAGPGVACGRYRGGATSRAAIRLRSEEHTSELQSLRHLVCRLLLEKKKYDRVASE